MRRLLCVALIAWQGTAVRADTAPALRLTLQEAKAEALLPVLPMPDRPGLYAQLPWLKLFRGGELRFAGLPAAWASPAPASGVRPRNLAAEWAVLKLKPPMPRGVVLLAYVSDPCPPCDRLIADFLAKAVPPSEGKVEQLRVVVR